jgi:kynurenine formamidase
VKIVDLTHPLSDDTPMMPGMAAPSFRDIARWDPDGYRMSEYRMLNHTGTHVDAPSHYSEHGDTLDEIGLERLVCDAVTLDVSARAPGPIPRAELEPLLAPVRAGDLLFLHSGNGARYGTEAYWTGWSYPDAEAAAALVELGISGIGFDGPSADPVDSQDYGLHSVWLEGGRLILENLANLDRLPERAPVVVAPLKVRGANGAPARVLAFLPEDGP